MKYLCLRTCYVNDRLWKVGEVYDLPDGMEKSERNFKPVEQPVEVEPEQVTEPKPEPVKPDVIPKGQYWCTKCKALHRETSKIGQRHLRVHQPKTK